MSELQFLWTKCFLWQRNLLWWTILDSFICLWHELILNVHKSWINIPWTHEYDLKLALWGALTINMAIQVFYYDTRNDIDIGSLTTTGKSILNHDNLGEFPKKPPPKITNTTKSTLRWISNYDTKDASSFSWILSTQNV